MSITTTNNRDLVFQAFSPITLEQLNAKASMLDRLDNKYIVPWSVVSQIVRELTNHFDILEINNQRSFVYETCYFDDDRYSCYFDHHQGRRKRFKVRTRSYVDAGLCFVEVKLKSTRGMTIKKRLAYDTYEPKQLDENALAYIRTCYEALYGQGFAYHFYPALEMRYRRITLVAKKGGERMTMDYGLTFGVNESSSSVSNDLFIIEAKSAKGNGIADKVLRQHHQHPTKHCSKYCVGMSFLNLVSKNNRFLPALKKLTL